METSIICVFKDVSLAADSDRSVSSCSIPILKKRMIMKIIIIMMFMVMLLVAIIMSMVMMMVNVNVKTSLPVLVDTCWLDWNFASASWVTWVLIIYNHDIGVD